MRVLAINGSPREEGNTRHALKTVCEVLEGAGIETEILHVGHANTRGCAACYACAAAGVCAFADEDFSAWTEKLYAADGVLLGSPVYYSGIAGNLKCFLDRAFFASRGRLRHKIAAGIVAVRRSGGTAAFDQLNKYFLIAEMVVAPSHYWNVAHGMAPGEVLQDAEGISVLRTLGQNMAWLLRMKEATKDTITPPEIGERPRTNFIR